MFLRTDLDLYAVVGGGQRPPRRPAPVVHDVPDVAALFYVSGGRVIRVMIEDGLTGRPA